MRKEKNNQRRKGLIPLIALLALFLVAGIAGGTYAYWRGNLSAPANVEDTSISIYTGAGKDVTTEITLEQSVDSALKLVPAERKNDSVGGAAANVEEITYTYTVNWDETDGYAPGTAGTLSVAKTSVTIGVDTDNAISDHVVVTISVPSSGAIVIGTPVTVTVKITLTEPANAADYAKIADKAISVKLTFSIALA